MNHAKTFTDLFPDDLAFEKKSRVYKGKKIVAVLKDSIGDLAALTCLDLGCSVGIISQLLADNFKEVIGADVDKVALEKAQQKNKKSNIKFLLSRETKIPIEDNQVDVIVCNQIYEHVDNPETLFNEMYRVLKTGGTIFLGARNKYGIWDGHYSIPFLAWVPHILANYLVNKFAQKDGYNISLCSLAKLNYLTRKFRKEDYTLKIISDPAKFASTDVLPSSRLLSKLALSAAKLFYFFIPNYIWILKKK